MRIANCTRWSVILSASFMMISGCTADPTSPRARDPHLTVTPASTVLTVPQLVTAVVWRSPVTGASTVSQRVYNAYGATITNGYGLRLVVPKGALPRDTMTISVKTIAGKIVAFDF